MNSSFLKAFTGIFCTAGITLGKIDNEVDAIMKILGISPLHILNY